MTQDFSFRVFISNNKILFAKDSITITIDGFSFCNGKHQIACPQNANAEFTCNGSKFAVKNVQCIPTVEDWYLEELQPKMQLLNLIFSNQAI